MNEDITGYVGLDVHKQSIAIAANTSAGTVAFPCRLMSRSDSGRIRLRTA